MNFNKVVIVFALFLNFGTPAFAYVDPGTGSAIVSLILGIIVGGWLFLKSFWYRIIHAIKKLLKPMKK